MSKEEGCGKEIIEDGISYNYKCGGYRGFLCPSCSPNSPITDFNKDTEPLGKPRGSLRSIKLRKSNLKWYHRNKDTEEYREARNLRKKKEYANNKEKYQAREKARKEVKLDGECEICKNNPQEHRHHEDYSKPLQVIKVCMPCHNRIHNG